MAIVKCPECGREVSDRATSCPGCGFPLGREDRRPEKEPEKEARIPRWAIILAILLVAVLAMCARPTKDNRADKEPDYAYFAGCQYIKDNYYSGAEFDYKSRSVSGADGSYDVSGKYSLTGVVHRFSIHVDVGDTVGGITHYTFTDLRIDGKSVALRR